MRSFELFVSGFAILFILSFFEYYNCFSLKRKKVIICLILLCYIIYSVMYNGPAGDYKVYERAFIDTDISHIPMPSEVYFEYLYALLSYFIRCVTDNYKLFRLVLAIIVMSLWYKIYTDPLLTIGNKYNFFVMLAAWALDSGYTHIARSTVAITICLYSIRFIRDRKIIKFGICVVIALGFHTMSIVWIPMYFLYNKIRVKNYLLVAIISLVLCINRMPQILSSFDFVFYKIPIVGDYVGNKIFSYLGRGLDNMYGLTLSYDFVLFKALINIIFCLILAQYLYALMHKHKRLFEETLLANQTGRITARDAYNTLFIQYLLGVIIYVVALGTSIALSRASFIYLAAQYSIFPYFLELQMNKCNKMLWILVFTAYLFMRMIVNF